MKPLAINLTEWESRSSGTDHRLIGLTLGGNPAIQQLAERLTTTGRLEILELARGLEFHATSYVGRVTLGDLTITIHPKLKGAPLLNLLRYAYGLRDFEVIESAGYSFEAWTFQDLLIHQLAVEVNELVVRGIHRNYQHQEDDLTSPRGRINFTHYLRTVQNATATLPCTYHPRIEDTPLNQVLLGGLIFASRQVGDLDLRTRLHHLARILGTTVTRKRLNAAALTKAWHAIDRRTTAYRAAITLIELILADDGLSLGGTPDQIRLPGFLFDMNRFFQTLLSRFLGEYLEGFTVEDERKLSHLFAYDPNRNPKRRQSPAIRPDFLILEKGHIVTILDAKYRDLWEKSLPREMLYQLAVYALGQPGRAKQAVILYPTLNPVACDQVINIFQPLQTGTSQGEVILRPVNLLGLDTLLRDKSPQATRHKKALAHRLTFG